MAQFQCSLGSLPCRGRILHDMIWFLFFFLFDFACRGCWYSKINDSVWLYQVHLATFFFFLLFSSNRLRTKNAKKPMTLRELELLNKLVIACESSERRSLKMLGTLGPSCRRFLPPCIAAAQLALPSRWGPFHAASYHLRKIRLGTRRHDKRRPPWKLQATGGRSMEFRMTIWEPGGGIRGCVNRIKRVNVDLCAWLALRFCAMSVMWYQRLSKPRRVWRGNAFISPQLGRRYKFKGKPQET